MAFTPEEQRIRDAALTFAKKNKKAIARRLTDPNIYLAEDNPVTVFMAGSPGAGKTEASIELVASLETGGSKVLRVDPDDLRCEFAAYTGENSWLFQPAVSILVEKIQDLALDQKQSFLLDGTLANFEIAERNIERSLKKGREVQILYVYQEPHLAWEFVCAREAVEGRRIPPMEFIDQYFAARDTVNRLKLRFARRVKVDLLLKNNDNSNRVYRANIDQIDNHVPEKYDRLAIERAIGLRS
jgi:UDP-N-acetylglucosamine kinase